MGDATSGWQKWVLLPFRLTFVRPFNIFDPFFSAPQLQCSLPHASHALQNLLTWNEIVQCQANTRQLHLLLSSQRISTSRRGCSAGQEASRFHILRYCTLCSWPNALHSFSKDKHRKHNKFLSLLGEPVAASQLLCMSLYGTDTTAAQANSPSGNLATTRPFQIVDVFYYSKPCLDPSFHTMY